MQCIKLQFHDSQIADPSGEQTELFKTIAKLLHTDDDAPLCQCDSFNTLTLHFLDLLNSLHFHCSRPSPNCYIPMMIHRSANVTHSTHLKCVSLNRYLEIANVDASVGNAPSECELNVLGLTIEVEIRTKLQSSPVKSREIYPIPKWLPRNMRMRLWLYSRQSLSFLAY